MSLDDCSQSVADSVTDNSQIRYSGQAEYKLTHKNLAFDLITLKCTYAGNRVVLTPQQQKLIKLLLLNPTQIIPRQFINDEICMEFQSHRENAASVLIYRTRVNLVDAGAPRELIETVRGKGCRLARGVE